MCVHGESRHSMMTYDVFPDQRMQTWFALHFSEAAKNDIIQEVRQSVVGRDSLHAWYSPTYVCYTWVCNIDMCDIKQANIHWSYIWSMLIYEHLCRSVCGSMCSQWIRVRFCLESKIPLALCGGLSGCTCTIALHDSLEGVNLIVVRNHNLPLTLIILHQRVNIPLLGVQQVNGVRLSAACL